MSEYKLTAGVISTAQTVACRTGSLTPSAYRLVKRNGELLLQGCYKWSQGFDDFGFDWRDIPTIEVE